MNEDLTSPHSQSLASIHRTLAWKYLRLYNTFNSEGKVESMDRCNGSSGTVIREIAEKLT